MTSILTRKPSAGWLLVAAPLLAGAVYSPKGTQENKEELIAKLSSDINKVDHTIEVTKDLIKRSPDAPYLADLYFRLAELYVEKSRYVFGRLMEQQTEGQKSLSGEKSLEVQLNKKLAIETYDKILADFPEYDNNDQVRFFKAHEFSSTSTRRATGRSRPGSSSATTTSTRARSTRPSSTTRASSPCRRATSTTWAATSSAGSASTRSG